MASLRLRRPENVAGEFFVDGTCIDCDLCRQIAPECFSSAGDQSAVHRQPVGDHETLAALKALVTCPTASIGTRGRHPVARAVAAYPEPIDNGVSFCGFAAESSFGASSYLIERADGNVLVDVPRFASLLAQRIESRGGVRFIFLTHRDDVADHERWARHFGAERILHAADLQPRTRSAERVLQGEAPIPLAEDLLAIPTPGHTPGHTVLLHRERFLFSGDHLWWSPHRRRLHASRSVCWYSWPEQIRSVQRLVEFPFEWVLPGHGRRHHAPREEMRHQLEDLLARMRH